MKSAQEIYEGTLTTQKVRIEEFTSLLETKVSSAIRNGDDEVNFQLGTEVYHQDLDVIQPLLKAAGYTYELNYSWEGNIDTFTVSWKSLD